MDDGVSLLWLLELKEENLVLICADGSINSIGQYNMALFSNLSEVL